MIWSWIEGLLVLLVKKVIGIGHGMVRVGSIVMVWVSKRMNEMTKFTTTKCIKNRAHEQVSND